MPAEPPAAASRPRMPARARWAGGPAAPTLVFFTSAGVLVLEILAGRLVAPYVGVSLETYTGIIGTVLAGIAVGTWIGGLVADRRDPEVLLGPLLIAAGAAALAIPPIVDFIGPGVADAGGGPAGIVALAVAAFVVPTALLSAVSPMVAKLRLRSTAETGTVVGGLSAAGTAGALAGTFSAGFIFIATWPTRTVVVAIGIVLVIAGAVLGAGRASANRRAAVLPAVALLLAGGAAAVVRPPCQQETTYYCVDVIGDPGRPADRTLVLDNLRHSYVDLADPEHLEFRYTRLFGAVIDAELDRGPLAALHIGGGGFTMPRWLAATRPGSTSTVLELDAGIVSLAQRELGLVVDDRLQVRTGDARRNIADEATDGFDLVVGDAFGGLSVPWHLTTVEMVNAIDRVLRPHGIYVLNVIDAGPRRLVRAELATLAAVFDHVAVIVPPGGGDSGNHVLVAGDRPLGLDTIASTEGSVLRAEALRRFIRDAKVLRDDYAPADQLLTRR